MAARIDHRSYKEQGIDLIPTIHEGYEVQILLERYAYSEISGTFILI